ncbi:arsenite methyltransferase [Haloarcula onubensis]|uniref:Arsenite methyltransferase n=1 Tax=Haloarcula onubensis TaxID=2950539 RepID=A0ABU2FP42_9EURY|nr:arsenite methyltransferase [Halomicroarcula sp. S3CR25-11]MDS0282520.1 arsenite methyltransferase [Halomicroarcula sp. S3CR25-11]
MTDTTTPADGTDDDQRRIVRERYAGIAGDSGGCCGPESDGDDGSCCDSVATDATRDVDATARQLGYDDDALDAVDGDANLGLGCGNPGAIAALDPGETVLDLGSGAGFDCFLAADAVGPDGRVVGVDMTPEMVEKARANARANDASDVEFRLGEIEHLPVADASVDVVISNCVVNLSPDKPQVFREAFRALRPGGRLAIADVVQTAPFPPEVTRDPDSLSACVAGAATVDALETALAAAGFEAIDIAPKDDSDAFIREWADEYDPSDYLVSATIEARKPA